MKRLISLENIENTPSGQLALFQGNRPKKASFPVILDIVKGYQIPFAKAATRGVLYKRCS